jgi:uncharacterized membrane protein YfcA
MDLYLPIAGMSVNALVIIALGGVVGLLTGMVGVGGGFLTTPILIFYGIRPRSRWRRPPPRSPAPAFPGVLATAAGAGSITRWGRDHRRRHGRRRWREGSCSACSSDWARSIRWC